MTSELWEIFDRFLDYVIVPLVAWIWIIHRAISQTNLEIVRLREENRRILTILEERQTRRTEDINHINDAMRELRSALTAINTKMDERR